MSARMLPAGHRVAGSLAWIRTLRHEPKAVSISDRDCGRRLVRRSEPVLDQKRGQAATQFNCLDPPAATVRQRSVAGAGWGAAAVIGRPAAAVI